MQYKGHQLRPKFQRLLSFDLPYVQSKLNLRLAFQVPHAFLLSPDFLQAPTLDNNIQLLKQMDVEVLLDDFGSGFSSLNYLARLPIAGIKIDETFSKLVAKDLRSAAIVSTITQLMRCLNIKTIVVHS